ncbi:hypothetical protein G6F37_008619 [Rhizopus arrhizus]|nr:hypothetical protein G6F38_006749 [Rhizopus arrhizus]KAG1155350.1 hypothetical protein G6F37_008619 [Rhizopus arrhizus]
MAENNERTFTQSETPLPVEIVTELENLSSSQHETNFKKFKRESHRYILDEWTTPEKINKSIYPELKGHIVETSYVVNHVYKLTENTRFQAKTTTEIFKQLNFLTTGTLGEEAMQSIILRCREQSRQLAIFGFVQAKKQEREAKETALKAFRLPNSLKYMESAEEDDQKARKLVDTSSAVQHESNDLSVTSNLQRVLSPGSQYKRFEDSGLVDVYNFMTMSTKALEDRVSELATVFIESVIDFGAIKIYMTSADFFLHNHMTIDDCANERTINDMYDLPTATVKENTYMNSATYYELSIHWGFVEILFTDGFYVVNQSPDLLLLGSSLKCWRHGELTSSNIHVLDNAVSRSSLPLLHAVAKLHTGALIVDKEIVFAMVTEAYGRSKAIDAHSESNQKSLPTPSNCVYGCLSVGMHEGSDGNGIKRKLKIGSSTMNILVTMSVLLRSEKTLQVGPETSASISAINPLTARIFYCDEEVERFLAVMNDPFTFTAPKTVLSLRQLTSGFGDSSTFLTARAAHDEFATDFRMPATVFSLCNLPHNQGYGASANSTGKLASRFLQSLALSIIFDKPTVDFKSALNAYNTAYAIKQLQDNDKTKRKSSKSWDVLSTFVEHLENVLKNHQDLSPCAIGTALDFGSLASITGQSLSSCAQRIEHDVLNHLKEKYSHID